MAKRKKRKSRRSPPQNRPSSPYRRALRQADELITRNDLEPRADNWQRLVLEWLVPAGPDRGFLAAYIDTHEAQLGPPWARDMLRLEIFFQAEDDEAALTHYREALSRYPRCALVELWLADLFFRYDNDFWRARRMYRYVMAELPGQPKPYYEMGFMHYLLGDFAGALDWFNQAADRVKSDDKMLGSLIHYNRGLMHYVVERDKKAAIADIKESLRRRRDYPQARIALEAIRRGEMRWVPW